METVLRDKFMALSTYIVLLSSRAKRRYHTPKGVDRKK